MAATFPNGVKTFTAITDGDVIQDEMWEECFEEVVAIQTELLTGRKGTFSATLGGTGGESGQVVTGAGFSFKYGNGLGVRFHIRMDVTTVGTITGTVLIGNLPFVADSSAAYVSSVTCGYWEGMGANFVNITGYIPPGQNYIVLHGITAAAATSTALVQAGLADGCTLFLSGFYEEN